MTASIATTLDQWRLRHPKLAAPGKAILGIGVMVILFMAAQSWLRAVTHLAPTAYAGPIILTELAGATLRSLMGLAGLAAFGVALMFRGRQILRPWSAFEHGAALRPLLMGVIALAAWFVSAFDPNPYFHQTYTLDRALVIALALAACWRPGFLPAFLWLAYALLWQFDYPLPFGYVWTEINLPLRILILYAIVVLLESLTGRGWSRPFLVTVISLVASSYWFSGINKVLLNWLAHPHIFWLTPGGYAHGWLTFLDPDQIRALTDAWQGMALPLMVLTMILECGSVLVSWRRPLTIGLLIGWALFHLGIVAACGISLWKWLLVDLALAAWWLWRADISRTVYSGIYAALSSILIVASPLWLRPTSLAWYDTPVTYTYQLEAVGEQGQSWVAPIRAFSRYAEMLAFGNLSYLDVEPRLNNQIWGATYDESTAMTLAAATSLADIERAEARYGRVEFDADRAVLFDQFIACAFEPGAPAAPAFSLQAPGHLWAASRGEAPPAGTPIERVRVHRLTWLYDAAQGPAVVLDKVVREIAITSSSCRGGP